MGAVQPSSSSLPSTPDVLPNTVDGTTSFSGIDVDAYLTSSQFKEIAIDVSVITIINIYHHSQFSN